MISQDPKTIGLALLGGIVPALIWLWFWLKEDSNKDEPAGLLTMAFILGMAGVFFVLPIERYIQSHIPGQSSQIIYWAMAEEIIKFLFAMLLLWKSSYINEPIDWAIYLITTALGFAALENAMFLIKPLSLAQTTVSLLTGQLRFLGSTLLHAVSTGIIGISIGLAYYQGQFYKKLYAIIGILVAIALHSAFNFFIMNNDGGDFLKVFGLLWVVTIIIMLLLEKVRRMSAQN